MNRGRLITLEGGEGAGKTTLMRALQEKLQEKGRAVIVTREPGGTPLGDEVRRWLLDSKEPIDDRAELLLFLAARADHVCRVIEPALRRGDIVLCDRFTHSTLAYQGHGRGLDLKKVEEMCAFAAHNLQPDLVLYLEVPVSVGMQRAEKRSPADRMECEKEAFHEAVRKGFTALAKAKNVTCIDGTQAPHAVAKNAWAALQSLL